MVENVLKYRRDIDGLRTLAVVPVILNHAGVPGLSGGFVGVDIFFVISGFLITGILHRELLEERFSIFRFYERRARRILPALFGLLVFCILAATLMFPPEKFVGLARSMIATLLFVSNMWFLRTTSDYFAPDSEFEPLLHTWSLAVEEQFYIIFPLLLWWLASRSRTVLVRVIAALCVLSFALSVWSTSAYPQANFYLAPTRAWELGLGALLALGVAPNIRQPVVVESIALLGLAAMVISIVLYDDTTPFPGISAALPCLGAACLLWAGARRTTAVGRMLSTPGFVGIGLISYSLYLWHWPILVLFRMKLGTLDISLSAMSLAVALSFICAFLSWRFIERPFRGSKGAGLSQWSIFVASGATIALMLTLSGVIVQSDGFPRRIPADIRMIYAGADDVSPDRSRCIGRTPRDGLCDIGVGGSALSERDVLLWGDSHAGALMPGLATLLTEKNLNGSVAFKSACPPILNVKRADKGEFDGCADFNSDVMTMLRSREDLQTVVLSARWALAAEGLRAPGEAGRTAILRLVDDVGSGNDPAGNFEVFAPAVAETVRAIRETGRRVIILGGIPEIGWSVPHTLGNHRFFGSPIPNAPTRNDIELRNARANGALRRSAADSGALLVSAIPILCTPVCTVQKDGRPLYSDDDHLSVFGATLLIREALSSVIGDTR